jgi:hypothetical protein
MFLVCQLYLQRHGLRVVLVAMAAALIAPPIIVHAMGKEELASAVNPIAYLVWCSGEISTEKQWESYLRWACPTICLVPAALGIVLAAMRIRFLLDMREWERKWDDEEFAKLDAQRAQTIARLTAAPPPAPAGPAAGAGSRR